MIRAKKILILLPILAFLLGQCIPHVLDLSLSNHRSIVNESIHSEIKLQSIEFSLNQWESLKLKENVMPNEVEWNGKQFDIHSISISGSKVQLWGLFDSTEDTILLALKHTTNGEHHALIAKIFSANFLFFEEVKRWHCVFKLNNLSNDCQNTHYIQLKGMFQLEPNPNPPKSYS